MLRGFLEGAAEKTKDRQMLHELSLSVKSGHTVARDDAADLVAPAASRISNAIG